MWNCGVVDQIVALLLLGNTTVLNGIMKNDCFASDANLCLPCGIVSDRAGNVLFSL